MRNLTRNLVLGALYLGLLAANSSEAATYTAGQRLPQNNSWAAKNESSTPPVHYSKFDSNFYGHYHVISTLTPECSTST